MPIEITGVAQSTWIVIAGLLATLLLTLRPTRNVDLLPISVTQELKGLAILSIVFAHIAYMLVNDSRFLYPLSVAAGVGVDLFLFISGYGLVVGMQRKRLSPREFYRRRLSRVFIPFWLVVALLFAADALLLDRHYSPTYTLQSALGWFPRASAWEDLNSPFWYISWILMFYLLFPLVYSERRPWLSALVLAAIANAVVWWDPWRMQANWLHHLHTNAFSLGMLLAWLLQSRPAVRERALAFRDGATASRRLAVMGGALLAALWLAPRANPGDWPDLAAGLERLGFDAGFFIGQTVSLATLGALLVLFALKRHESRLLHLFGVYSYETYLLHWPLMSRYDVFYHTLPAWIATIAWLAAFIGLGWMLRKVLDPIEGLVDRR
jgi:peptidoglycan/LPS O-acetylase OafA/YrhL